MWLMVGEATYEMTEEITPNHIVFYQKQLEFQVKLEPATQLHLAKLKHYIPTTLWLQTFSVSHTVWGNLQTLYHRS
jgi:hypothetical protein